MRKIVPLVNDIDYRQGIKLAKKLPKRRNGNTGHFPKGIGYRIEAVDFRLKRIPGVEIAPLTKQFLIPGELRESCIILDLIESNIVEALNAAMHLHVVSHVSDTN